MAGLDGRRAIQALAAVVLAACSPGPDRQDGPGASGVRPVALDVTVANREARELFGAIETANASLPEAFGGYADGCVAGARQLPETGPTWQAMRLSRNRNWGHPVLIDYVQDLSAEVARLTDWRGLYVGDMSQPRGGPMLTGHRSHQSGLDVDIWMRPATDLDLGRRTREVLSSISTRRERGAFVNADWSEDHWQVLRAAASDPRVARIFVFPGAKVWMCENETGDRSYLRNIRPWWGHHYHFHVRLSCPEGSPDCVNQDPPPPGDGCDEARQWVANILDPPPPDPAAPPPAPRRELTMADLPAQCSALIE